MSNLADTTCLFRYHKPRLETGGRPQRLWRGAPVRLLHSGAATIGFDECWVRRSPLQRLALVTLFNRLGTKNVTNLLKAAHTVLDEMTEELITADTEAAEAKRRQWGALLLEATRAEFSAIGVVADHRYYASKTIIHDDSKAPAWGDRIYSPSTKPGHRAPCTRLSDGTLLYDAFGREFTLVAFADASEADVQAISAEAARINFPLKVLSLGAKEERIRKLYEVPMVLVRPDQAVRSIIQLYSFVLKGV